MALVLPQLHTRSLGDNPSACGRKSRFLGRAAPLPFTVSGILGTAVAKAGFVCSCTHRLKSAHRCRQRRRRFGCRFDESPIGATRFASGCVDSGGSIRIADITDALFDEDSDINSADWKPVQQLSGVIQVSSPEMVQVAISKQTIRGVGFTIYTLSTEPKLVVVPNVVTDDEIAHLLDLCEGFWKPSETGSCHRDHREFNDVANEVSDYRTSYSSELPEAETPTVEEIELRLAQLAGTSVDCLEPLSLVRYEPGQLFNLHHDGIWRSKTIFVYLNDLPPCDGGETLFPELGLRVTPTKGCAIMWPNTIEHQVDDPRVVHQGLPPQTAVKYGMNCFFDDQPIRKASS